MMPPWRFSIDVGGTFTDVIAVRPDGAVLTHKLLSTGVTRGTVSAGSTADFIVDPLRTREPDAFWQGYRLRLPDPAAPEPITRTVTRFEADLGTLHLDRPLTAVPPAGTSYELASDEPAPVVAIRFLLGRRLDEPIGAVQVRLGTTRATNALLERKGARTALVTTRGFADILRIGNQDRPHLFDLNIRKREELAERVIEIDERLAADGSVLVPLNEPAAARELRQAKSDGIQSLAVCLLHAATNPVHEQALARIARDIGFAQVSLSSDVSRLQRIVPRADTTVLDAYLGPVIAGYVARLRRCMPDARIQLMTNAGGLIDAAAVSGKDTVLSGPAGGVVGCAHVASAAGFIRAIGFDMGGTSTDVCRVEPPPQRFEYQQETVKAGVRMMTPMLAIETVAAGGGSICRFDGIKLVVGPESAGADPGPACYGRGGPLTVTDVNLFLGRIVPEAFPFALDEQLIEDRIDEVVAELRRGTGQELTRVQIADGFRRIANANMAAAIREISVAKGYDPREYVLCTFGGAGGQHACAIAESLGIEQICISPLAGVLSAAGIGVAESKRILERSVSVPLDAQTTDALDPVLQELTDQARCELLAEGLDPSRLDPPLLTWDLCYVGQSSSLTTPWAPAETALVAFEDAHRRQFGYTHENRGVEVRVVRVELTAGTDPIDFSLAPRTAAGSMDHARNPTLPPTPVASRRTTSLRLGDAMYDAPVFLRHELPANWSANGPAVLVETTSTTVVDPGWRANLNDRGDVTLQRIASIQTAASSAVTRPRVDLSEPDPVQLELFNNRFASIAEQMGNTLRRTALSTNVKERLDYSCAIFTPTGELVVNAPHIPVHLGGMSGCVKALIEDVPAFHPGDVYITNDPYRGGSHLNDVTVVTPVYDSAGQQLLFFVASRAHHAEIGGTRPGSMPPDSTCLAQEGVVIRAFRWLEDGRTRADALRDMLTRSPYPSRSPDENLADIAAQVAANRTGAAQLLALTDRLGRDLVHAYMGHIQTAAERKMRAALLHLPDANYHFEDALDDGSPLVVTVGKQADSAVIDFTGTGPVLSGNLNANPAIVASAVLYCLRCLIDEDIPLNSGVLAPVQLILPECFLNPPFDLDPARCAAVAGGNVETSQRIVDVIFGALRTVAASQGTMNNLLIGNDRFGYYETICGGAGAGPGFAGADAVHTHMTNTRLTDPELLEARYPLRLHRFTIRYGSGGPGRHRGGSGVIREFEFLDELELSIISQRRARAPYGLSGGEPGQPGRNRLWRSSTGTWQELGPIAQARVQPGDRLVIESPGGGGYGPST